MAMADISFTGTSQLLQRKTNVSLYRLNSSFLPQKPAKFSFNFNTEKCFPSMKVVCSVAPSQTQAPTPAPTTTLTPDGKRTDCYGIFCLTYDLKEEEKQKSWKKLIKVAVSGAAGMISNHLLFMIASGEAFGQDQPIALQLLGSERSFAALEGVAMELEDSLYPLLREVSIGVDPYEVFRDAEWALLIGAKPRGPGMERADLLDINGQIFAAQGKALNAVASPNVKVLVVGNPCNTNALICLKNAPKIPPKNFHALTRLDENRAKCQLALKAGVFYDKVSNMTIWGNHSTTQVPDFLNAKIHGRPVKEIITDIKWLEDEFTEKVQKRGGVLIKKWGRSSAASTAVSIVDAQKTKTFIQHQLNGYGIFSLSGRRGEGRISHDGLHNAHHTGLHHLYRWFSIPRRPANTVDECNINRFLPERCSHCNLGMLQRVHLDWCIYLDSIVDLFRQHDDLLVYCISAIQNLISGSIILRFIKGTPC